MYRTRRMFAMFMVVALLLSAVPAFAQDDECPVKVGLVTDVGRLNDQSFNEAAWMGIQAAMEELGLGEECYDYIETTDTADYIPNIELFIGEGYNIIVTSGYLMTTATRQAGLDNPDVFFIGTDQSQENEDYEYEPIENVAGLVFDESVSGFLAGALAGLMTETNIIAGVYGTDIVPAVPRFGMGYELGAKYVNPEIEVLTAYHPGTPDVAFVDAQWGGETTGTMLDENADIVFAAGGTTGNGGLIAGCNAGFPVIGVDFDQYFTVPEVQSCIMSSATKDLVGGVSALILAANEGTFVGGNIFGGAGLAPYHDWEDKIPDEVKAEIDNISMLIDEGLIDTCPDDNEQYGMMCYIAGMEIDPGVATVQEYCLGCHDTARIGENLGQGDDWWTQTLDAMMGQDGGPELSEEEIAIILEFLHR